MDKMCAICGIKATKIDYNGDNYCSIHINCGKKNEKKVKRVKLSDELYWEAVKAGAEKNMDLHTHISDLISRDIMGKKS